VAPETTYLVAGRVLTFVPAHPPAPREIVLKTSLEAAPRPRSPFDREPRRRTYLMCRPTYFDVVYSINPWMDTAVAVDRDRAVRQWERLRDTYVSLGHAVELIEPVPGLPDMVFTANGATVIDGRVLVARFRHWQRAAESVAHQAWFERNGYRDVEMAGRVGEGQGDYLLAGELLLAGTGFRTDLGSHAEVRERFDRPVVALTLVDPHYYHLDTALGVLSDDHVMYYPAAFSPDSRATLEALFPDAIRADAADASVLGLNAVSDGRHVVLPAGATHLADELARHGYEPIPVDTSELLKAGGAVKCCTLELPALVGSHG
jgi:N-dimethylarginine dimethylaminohydrolase